MKQDLTKAHRYVWDNYPSDKDYCVCGLPKDNQIHPYEFIKTEAFQKEHQRQEDQQFQLITSMLEDQGEPFLERVRDWIQDYLDESYSRGD